MRVHVPEVEECVGQAEQSLADPAEALLALGHSLEVAKQVREADLALTHENVQIHDVSVRDDEAGRIVTDQLARDIPAPGVPDDEDRGILAYPGPHPCELVALPPCRLVKVLGSRFSHGNHGFLMGGGEPLSHAPLDVRDRAERHGDAVDVFDVALDVAPRHPVLTGQEHHESREVRPEGAFVGAFGQTRLGGLTAVAEKLMEPPFDHQGVHRRNIHDLVDARVGVFTSERGLA